MKSVVHAKRYLAILAVR